MTTKKKEPIEESESAPQDTTTQGDEQTTEQLDRSIDAPTTIQISNRHVMSLPLMRIDAAKREVWGQATAEVPDSYGTIFGYYPDGWKMWRGNIREQHDSKKAVGKRVDLECDDMSRSVRVGSRISRGAQDTWLKVEDDVLTGYSASIIPDPEYGPDPKKWPKKLYNGKEYPYLPRYTVAELSLVDNPACPGCNIQIVRADGFATDVLDLTEEEVPPPAATELVSTEEVLSRAGARMSQGTQGKMHQSIAHTLHAVATQMQNCGCDACMAAMKMIDPDGDGDIDLGGYDDPDGDWQSLYASNDMDVERAVTGIVERVIEHQLSAVYSRLQGIAGTLARSNANTATFETLITSAITRAVEASVSAHETSLAEVRASQEAVKEQVGSIAKQVENIANTPIPGSPINTGALPRPVQNRTLATDSPASPNTGALYNAMQEQFARNSQAGIYPNMNAQLEDAAKVLVYQPATIARR